MGQDRGSRTECARLCLCRFFKSRRRQDNGAPTGVVRLSNLEGHIRTIGAVLSFRSTEGYPLALAIRPDEV